MHRSVSVANAPALRLLLQFKASSSVPDSYGDTPMHYACYTGNAAAVRILLEAGASPFVPNIAGVTPVAAAAEDGHWALVLVVERLVGALILELIPRLESMQPLHLAVKGTLHDGHVELGPATVQLGRHVARGAP